MFQPLPDIYEPSAIQQLPDGRFLVVEDEVAHPFSLLTIAADGSANKTPLLTQGADGGAALPKLDDLEALAVDAAGFVCAITSHSRNGDGEEKKSRERLVRFRVDGDRVAAPAVATGLKAALAAQHPVLAAAATSRDAKTADGFNIEALEITPDGRRLLLGFRSPLLDGRALVAGIENPAELFAGDAAPRISPRLDLLDLGGHGIRGMSFVPALGGHLVISGPVSKERAQFRLWFWRGETGDRPRAVSVAGLPGFEHAEGVCPALLDGRQRIIIVSDDGSREARRPAGFLLLDPASLHIAP